MLDFRDIGGRIVHGVQLEITAVYRGAVTWCYWHLALYHTVATRQSQELEWSRCEELVNCCGAETQHHAAVRALTLRPLLLHRALLLLFGGLCRSEDWSIFTADGIHAAAYAEST